MIDNMQRQHILLAPFVDIASQNTQPYQSQIMSSEDSSAVNEETYDRKRHM